MKKILTIDDITCSFISAVAYGFGYSIPAAYNAPGWLCLVICFALGLFTEEFSAKIIYSKYVQEKPSRRIIVSLLFVAFFIICEAISNKILGSSLTGSLEEQIITVIIFALIGFFISIIKRRYKHQKIMKRYGDGKNGYKLNVDEKEYIKSLDKENKEILGDYDSSLAVKTRTGIFVGEKENDVISFNGIPYAKPPIGKLRWKAPEKLEDSDKVFEAKYFSASSIQVNYEGNTLRYHAQSEDCLYLNVCTESIDNKANRPVIVYLHGGDYTFGGSADPLWETFNFVKINKNVVTVTFNYRLGLLGFIDFSNIPGGQDYKDSDNLGILDQIAALKWIKENIKQFGGNPNNITLMGDGAGGASISLLGVCSKANKLFNNAIILSGNSLYFNETKDDAKVLMDALLKETNASSVSELLSLTENDISNITQKLKEHLLVPNCDGKLIPENITEAYRSGIAKKINYIICLSRDNVNSYASAIGRNLSMNMINDSIDYSLKKFNSKETSKLKSFLNETITKFGEEKGKIIFSNYLYDNIDQFKLAQAINKGGSATNLLYWDVDPVIENLGAGVTRIVNTILKNEEVAEVYGNVIDESHQEILNAFIMKMINNEELKLYNNEVVGIDEIKWESFPYMLTFSNNDMALESTEILSKDATDYKQ